MQLFPHRFPSFFTHFNKLQDKKLVSVVNNMPQMLNLSLNWNIPKKYIYIVLLLLINVFSEF